MATINSMTGFGQGRAVEEDVLEVSIQLRSLNSRHAEIHLRLPPSLYSYEPMFKKRVSRSINRGKLEVFVKIERARQTESRYVFDTELAARFYRQALELSQELSLERRPGIETVLRLPGVIRQEIDESDLEEENLSLVLEALDKALSALNSTRSEEGAALARDVSNRLDTLEGMVRTIKEGCGEVTTRLYERIQERVLDLNRELKLDQERLMQEVAYYADRGDITEELVRLESHLTAFRQALERGSPAGRRLEFILQEINREVNTTGSKVRTPDLSAEVISMKSEIEKIREQILNLE